MRPLAVTDEDVEEEDTQEKDDEENSSVWDVVGDKNAVGAFVLRFGDRTDQFFFRIMRVVAQFDAIYIPFLLSFGNLSWLSSILRDDLATAVDILMNVIYALGVILQLRTSVVDVQCGTENVCPDAIFNNRIRSSTFWFDAISLIGAFWVVPGVSQYVAVTRLLRCWRLSTGADDLYELHTAELSSEDAVRNLLDLLVNIWLMIHCASCCWFFAMTVSIEDWEQMLYTDERYLGGDLVSLYVLYFSYGAAMMGGWTGPPKTLNEFTFAELAVCCVLSPTAALYNGFVFSQLLDVIKQAGASTSRHLDRLAELSSLVDSMLSKVPPVPRNLKLRILRFHSYLSINNANAADYEMLLNPLGDQIREDIKKHLFNDMIRSAPFLKNVPDEYVNHIVTAVTEEVFGPNECVFQAGDRATELYFIMKGTVEVSYCADFNEGGKRATRLSTFKLPGEKIACKCAGDYFGELGLVFNEPRTATIKTQSWCMFAKLSRSAFQSIVEEAPHVRQIIVEEIVRKNYFPEAMCKKFKVDPLSSRSQSDEYARAETTPLLETAQEEKKRVSVVKPFLEVHHAASPTGGEERQMLATLTQMVTHLVTDVGKMRDGIDSRLESIEYRLNGLEDHVRSGEDLPRQARRPRPSVMPQPFAPVTLDSLIPDLLDS